MSFEGNKNCVGEFVDVVIKNVRKSVIYGEIVDKEMTEHFKEKNFICPIECSILPKDQKTMKMLRENKKNKKLLNDNKSKR